MTARPCQECGFGRPVLNGEYFRDLRLRASKSLKEMAEWFAARGIRVSYVSLSRMERGDQPFLEKYAAGYDELLERRGRR